VLDQISRKDKIAWMARMQNKPKGARVNRLPRGPACGGATGPGTGAARCTGCTGVSGGGICALSPFIGAVTPAGPVNVGAFLPLRSPIKTAPDAHQAPRRGRKPEARRDAAPPTQGSRLGAFR
jgi:hypothetical protein